MTTYKLVARSKAPDSKTVIATCETQSHTFASLTADHWRKRGFLVDHFVIDDETTVEHA